MVAHIAGANLWIGVTRAGNTVAEKAPIFLEAEGGGADRDFGGSISRPGRGSARPLRTRIGSSQPALLDLESLFADPRAIEPFVASLTDALRPYEVSGVCGPLLGGAFLAQLLARRLGAEFCFAEREMPSETLGLYGARYRIPAALAARAAGKRFAIVDDVMSAGSALRGTYADLRAHGATCVVAGALLVLGSAGADYFADEGIPVEATARRDFELWKPARCPLCAAGVPLEDMAATRR